MRDVRANDDRTAVVRRGATTEPDRAASAGDQQIAVSLPAWDLLPPADPVRRHR